MEIQNSEIEEKSKAINWGERGWGHVPKMKQNLISDISSIVWKIEFIKKIMQRIDIGTLQKSLCIISK